MTEFDWVTLIIAIYGAFLSTALFGYRIYVNRRRIEVKLQKGVTKISQTQIYVTLSISFTNNGKRPIQIDSYGIKLPDKQQLFVSDLLLPKRFPIKLMDGEGDSVTFDIKNIAQTLHESGFTDTIEIRGFVRDASDEKYYSERTEFNIDNWLED